MRGQGDRAREGGRKQTAEAAGGVKGEGKEENQQNDGGGCRGCRSSGFALQHRARTPAGAVRASPVRTVACRRQRAAQDLVSLPPLPLFLGNGQYFLAV